MKISLSGFSFSVMRENICNDVYSGLEYRFDTWTCDGKFDAGMKYPDGNVWTICAPDFY